MPLGVDPSVGSARDIGNIYWSFSNFRTELVRVKYGSALSDPSATLKVLFKG